MPFNPPPVSRSPKSIGVAGTSKIKIESVQAVVDRMGLHSSVNGIAGLNLGLESSPMGRLKSSRVPSIALCRLKLLTHALTLISVLKTA
jgi:hypothetical protein